MTEKPELDPEVHEDDTTMSVWKRRMVLILLIVLVVAVAAPTFAGCSGFVEAKKTAATFEVEGTSHVLTDEDLHKFIARYQTMYRLFDPRRGMPEGDEFTKQALRTLMLDAAAKAQGIHVPDERVITLAHRIPAFMAPGTAEFDERQCRNVLAQFGGALSWQTLCETLRTEMRVAEYMRSYSVAYDLVPGDDAYESWKKRNVKLTVDYVASPFDAAREKVAAIEPTDEDLRTTAELPAVKALLAVPPRKTVEVAYVKAAEMTAEQLEAARNFAYDAEIFDEDQTLDAAAIRYFMGHSDIIYTKERWRDLTDPSWAKAHRDWEDEHAKWEKEPKEGRRAEPVEPKDPAADYDAKDEIAKFELWRDRVIKETLAERIVQTLGERADKEGRALSDVGAEYARFGVKVVRNAEPLTDAEIVQKFPDPVARDSEFDQVVIAQFKAPAEGAVFKRQFQKAPVPTTKLADRIADRGWMVIALEGCDPARLYPVAEKKDLVVDFWRRHRVGELARSLAEEIQKKVSAAGPDAAKMSEAMKQAAKDAGLEVQTLRRFNRTTSAPKAPVAGPNGQLSEESQKLARRIAARNRVQQDYGILSLLDAGKLREPVLVDEKTEAAFVIFVVEKHEPAPLEMQDAELRQERIMIASQTVAKSNELNSYEALAKRFNLQRFDAKDAKKPAKETKPENG